MLAPHESNGVRRTRDLQNPPTANSLSEGRGEDALTLALVSARGTEDLYKEMILVIDLPITLGIPKQPSALSGI